MHPFIRTRLHEIDTARATVEELLAETSTEQRHWQSEPTSWSLLQVLDHLNAAAEQYHPRVRRLIERLRERGATSDRLYRPSLFARLFNHSAGPDGKLKLPAPSAFRPPPAADDVVERYHAQQNELTALLHEADGLSLNRLSLGSPITPLIRFSLGEAFELLTRHQLRHVAQMKRIREHPRFPPKR